MALVFNVITMIECVILQDILRKLCFACGRKRHFNGSYGLRMT